MCINRRIKDIIGSTTLAITAKVNELKANGHDVVNFAAGEPDFDTPKSIKAAAIAAIEKGLTKYTPTSGTQELRETIAAKFKKDNQLGYKPSQIVVSCGAKHSIFNIIQVLADEDEEVLIPAPYWVSYPEMVKAAGAISKFIPTTAKAGFKITPEDLRRYAGNKTKILILNSPSNPTGMVYSRKELEPIAEFCVKNNIFVISDEIYEKLIYDTQEYTSIGALGKDIFERTITVNGVSKAYAMTGWRIGYAAGREDVMEYVKKFQDHATSNPASISQAAAVQALKEPEDGIRAMRDEFRKRRDLMAAGLKDVSQISYVLPQGAFYLFCDFSKLGFSEQIARQILNDVKVAAIPCDSFGAPGFIRLSFATSAERIQEGTKRIKEWIRQQAAC
ncbi:MAG: pyridoxal phosphate-dependent aminotransferase [Candidatus Omnitrophica bacterium]|nr:pyridoxal phosphate-dependent aminotransferase [Candidatus Omnitrophota bacterium]MBI5025110.1 pyridoxal phosphate-dependent aminotransferase [Candidatus Omnitrophota bacterium]